MTLTNTFQLASNGACFIQADQDFKFCFKSAVATNIFDFNFTPEDTVFNYDGSLGAVYVKEARTGLGGNLIVEVE